MISKSLHRSLKNFDESKIQLNDLNRSKSIEDEILSFMEFHNKTLKSSVISHCLKIYSNVSRNTINTIIWDLHKLKLIEVKDNLLDMRGEIVLFHSLKT